MGGPPSQAELQSWASTHGHTFPVISLQELGGAAEIFGNSISAPNEALFAPGLELVDTGSISDAQIQSALP
ncbi:MAG: hypothetical protein AAGA54_19025 [Myxococcota bacterium]